MKRVILVIVVIFIALAAYMLLRNNAGLRSKLPLQGVDKDVTVSQNGKPRKPLTNGITATGGYTISLFAENISGARDLQFTPGGTLLVSAPGGGTVFALPDTNDDGVADSAKAVVTGENTPHGLAFFDNKLYVVNNDKVVRYTWDEKNVSATNREEVLTIPAGENHIYRTITLSKDGQMFVSIGSTCNVCIENNPWFNTIITADKDGKNARIYAKGQRNAPFMAIRNSDNTLWATGMGRDYLGDNLPPDEINLIKDNADYGWPYCYGNKVYDTNFNKGSASDCINTVAPVFEIPAHSAPLGITFIDSAQFPQNQQGDLLVAYHGSWNRTIPDGYKVVRMNVEGDTISNAEDFITGFIQDRDVVGRPVDLTFDKSGMLFISDDKVGAVYKVTK